MSARTVSGPAGYLCIHTVCFLFVFISYESSESYGFLFFTRDFFAGKPVESTDAHHGPPEVGAVGVRAPKGQRVTLDSACAGDFRFHFVQELISFAI